MANLGFFFKNRRRGCWHDLVHPAHRALDPQLRQQCLAIHSGFDDRLYSIAALCPDRHLCVPGLEVQVTQYLREHAPLRWMDRYWTLLG